MNYLSPNLIISLISSFVIMILIYYINKRNKEEFKNSTYVKQYILLTISIFVVLYIKKHIPDKIMSGGGGTVVNFGQPNYQSNINVGEPNF